MGLFKNIKNAQTQARDAMANAGGAPATGGMGNVPGMGGMDMAAMAAESQKLQRLANAGVEAPGVIHAIRPSGETEISGGQKVELDISIRPVGGDPYQTTVSQSLLPAQLEGLAEGKSVTVKYDPEAPAMAVLHSW